MAVLSITIPDAHVNRVRQAFVGTYGLAVEQTAAQLVQDKVAGFVKEIVRSREAALAGEAARVAALATADADLAGVT